MTFGDSLHYLTIGNPVSKALIGTTTSIFTKGGGAGVSSIDKLLIQNVAAVLLSGTVKEFQ